MTPHNLAAFAAAVLIAAVVFPHTVALRLFMLCFGTILIAIAVVQGRSPINALPPLWLPFGLWALWALASIMWSIDPQYSIKEFRNEVVYAAVTFWLCYTSSQAPRAPHIFLPMVGVASAVVCVIAISYYPDPARHAGGWHGGAANFTSAVLALMPCILMLVWYTGRQNARRAQAILAALAILMIVAAYTSHNRTMWLGLGVQLLVMGALLARRGAAWTTARRLAASVAGLAVAATAAWMTLHIHEQRRVDSPEIQAFAEDPRLGLWPLVLDKVQERPLTGYGFGRGLFRETLTATFDEGLMWHAHNLFLDILLQTGVPGLVLLLVLLFATLRYGWLLARHHEDAAAACGIALFAVVAGMVVRNFTDTLWVRQNALLYWAIVGLLLAWGGVRARARPIIGELSFSRSR